MKSAIAYILGVKGERDLINQSIIIYNQ